MWLWRNGPAYGGDTALTGDLLTVFGTGFCGSAACSPVTLLISNRVAAAGVAVDQNGNFQAEITVLEGPETYPLTALQQLQGGQVLTHTVRLLVLGGEAEDVLELPRPRLAIRSGAQGLLLAWPVYYSNHSLEWTANLSDPNAWQPFQVQISQVGVENVAFVQPTETRRFFRLRGP